MFARIGPLLQRLLMISYHPQPDERGFLARAETQTSAGVEVTVCVPDAKEAERLFGVPLARRGLQPVHLRVVNRSKVPLRLHFRSIDPHYFPPLEAAARCHYSILKRIPAFGVFAVFYFPLLFLAPIKLWSVTWANRQVDTWFQSLGFHRRPIGTGETSEGFVFTSYDAGTKLIRVQLMATENSLLPVQAMAILATPAADQTSTPGGQDSSEAQGALPGKPVETSEEVASDRMSANSFTEPIVDLNFTVQVAGINADYLHRKLDNLIPANGFPDCDLPTLMEHLRTFPTVTHNHLNKGSGDPINLVVIGDFETLLTAFSARWDETEVISLATCWKTAQSFLLGVQYRYSPVSSLYLFGRSQDIALQQIRKSISARLHLRLWLAPVTFERHPVWIGQVSRDIGVRFTMAVWNLTTHRIDPDVDEARDYVLEDLLDAERVRAAGYVDATTPCSADSPRPNLTGDPYFTDGKRVVIRVGPHLTAPQFIAWS